MIEEVILSNLLLNEDYSRKVVPFLRDEYFSQQHHRIIYNLVDEYIKKYNSLPTKEALVIELSSKTGLTEQAFNDSKRAISEFKVGESQLDWLLDSTEKFCQEKAIYNAIM